MNQNMMVSSHLKRKGSISPLQALKLFGIFRLSARIFDLRRAGMKIDTIMQSVKKKRFAKFVLR